MKKFNKIYIEITNNCNLSCSFCSIDNRLKEFISLENFEKIIKQIDEYSDYVYLHVKGEPLLHPNLDKILDICSKYNKKVNITTNGTLLKLKKDVLLKPCVRQINISLHSENNKEHYLNEIFASVEQLSEHKLITYRFWTMKNNKLNKKSTEFVDKISDYYNLTNELTEKIIKENNITIKNNVFISKDNQFIWPDLTNDYCEDNGYCYGLKSHIAILVDGTVVPCCLDSNGVIKLGNVFLTNLSDILNSNRAISIRNNFNNRKACEDLCRHCSFKSRFNKK